MSHFTKLGLLSVTTGYLLLLPYLSAAKLIIKGSDTLGAKLVPQLAEVFSASYPLAGEALTIEIAAEGSATGIASVLDGTADIGMLSRGLRPEEIEEALSRGLDLALIEVARDALVVVVHPGNPLKSLTLSELAAVFTGDVVNWAALSDFPEPISAYSRNSSSGTYEAFQQLALNARNYSSQIQKMASNEQIAHEVSGNPAGIGYVALAYAQNPTIRMLPINGSTATAKDYPLARPLFFLFNRDAENNPLGEAFIDFTTSEAGQAVVTKLEFLPAQSDDS
tara:strand:+ start:2241 stop:3080 length:840 start_codon:yes stop_codon:yes gene_type:complete